MRDREPKIRAISFEYTIMRRYDSIASRESHETIITSDSKMQNSCATIVEDQHKIPTLPNVSIDMHSENDSPALVSPTHEELGLPNFCVHEETDGMEISLQLIKIQSAPKIITARSTTHVIPQDISDDAYSTVITPPKAFCSPFMSFEALTDLLLFNKPLHRKRQPPPIKRASPIKDSPTTSNEPNFPFSCGQCKVNDESPSKVLSFQCGIPNCCYEDNSTLDPETAKQRRCMELGIGNMLGSINNSSTSSALCCGTWQMWSLSCFGKSNLSPDMRPEQVGRVLRNRAGNLNSQTRRLRKLQNSLMHTQQQDQNQPSGGGSLKGNRSFDERLRYSLLDDYVQMKRSVTADATPCSSVTGTTISCNSGMDLSNLNIGNDYEKYLGKHSPGDNSQELYYDSDPGEFCKIRCNKDKARRDFKYIHNGMDLAEAKSPALTKRAIVNEVEPERFEFDASDSQQISMLIQVRSSLSNQNFYCICKSSNTFKLQETLNKCFALTWHPIAKSERKSYSPVRVKAWIELGTQLRSRLIQPKLIWKIMTESELQSTKCSFSNIGLSKVELLDIVRVLEPNKVDRTKYPFVKKSCCFSVHTVSDSFMFEAVSQVEKEKLVTGLKLSIARLGSKIVMGDESVFEEFFSPFGDVDPGKPPPILREGI